MFHDRDASNTSIPLADVGKQRNATIAFADIVGYTVLTTADELGTISRWLTLFGDCIKPAAEALGGRVLDLRGDGVLAEFPDADSALAWSQAVHAGSEALTREDTQVAPMTLRIAVHTGAIISTAHGLFGDTINLAARLQEYAPPGGVILTEAAAARASQAGRVVRDLGQLPLRGLSRAVHAYAIDPESGIVPVPLAPPPSQLPSVAVLPLVNVNADPAQDHLADGIVEDVITSLAALREVFVIDADSARMFRGTRPNPLRVGRTLAVRYVVSGTLSRDGDRLTVAVHLSDTLSGETLWGERIEAAAREIFDVQEYVVAAILAGIAPNLRAAALREAMRKRPENLTAYDLTLQGVHALCSVDRGKFADSRAMFERAIAEDPGFAAARAWAARWHSMNIARGWSTDGQADADAAMASADAALALDAANALALATRGHMLAFIKRNASEALDSFKRALHAAPNSATAWTLSSATMAYLGRGAEAVQAAEKGLRLSPYDPLRASQQFYLGLASYAAGELDKAEQACRAAIGINPEHGATWLINAAILAAQGQISAAADAARRTLALRPRLRLSVYERDQLPIVEPALRNRVMRDLRAAGLPE